MNVGHLARRFFGSLKPGGASAADEAWARAQLTDAERDLWERMSGADRRHAAGVARRVDAALSDSDGDGDGVGVERPVLAAALLHDVGKIACGLGTYGRVVATVAGAAGGRDMAAAWSSKRGFTRRVGLYLRHDELGGDLLAVAGSDPLTETWAREHHLPANSWTVPADIGAALKAADDD